MVHDTLQSMFDKNLSVRAAACKCLSTIIKRGFDVNSEPVVSAILEVSEAYSLEFIKCSGQLQRTLSPSSV